MRTIDRMNSLMHLITGAKSKKIIHAYLVVALALLLIGGSIKIFNKEEIKAETGASFNATNPVMKPDIAALYDFNEPRSIAFDSQNNIYIVENGSNAITKFDPTGTTLIKRWGSLGYGDNQFDGPRGIAIDGDNNLYVADYNNFRVVKMDTEGNWLGWWGKDTQNTIGWHEPGSGKKGKWGIEDGAFENPLVIKIGPDQKVYVSDFYGSDTSYGGRIQTFEKNGQFIRKIGSRSYGDGELNYIRSSAKADSQGNIYLADSLNNRIMKYDPNFNFLGWWGKDSVNGLGWHSVGSGKVPYKYGSSEVGAFDDPRGISLDSQDNLYVADSTNSRIVKITPQNNISVKTFGSGTEESLTSYINDVTLDSQNNIYLIDDSKISKYDSNYVFKGWWGRDDTGVASWHIPGSGKKSTTGSRDGSLDKAMAINIYQNNIYVAEHANNRVQKFVINEDGSIGCSGWWGEDNTGFAGWHAFNPSVITIYPKSSNKNMGFYGPEGVTTDGQGNIFVSDSSNHRIVVINNDGNFGYNYGALGHSNENLARPHGLINLPNNRVAVTDSAHKRLKIFQTNGSSWTYQNSVPAQTKMHYRPFGFDVDDAGNIFISHVEYSSGWSTSDFDSGVAKFDQSGNMVLQIGFGSDIGYVGGVFPQDLKDNIMNVPRAIELNNGKLYVGVADDDAKTDGKGTIKEYSTTGSFIRNIIETSTKNDSVSEGTPGKPPSSYSQFFDFKHDADGNFWIVDTGATGSFYHANSNNRILKYDSNFNFLQNMGRRGNTGNKIYYSRGHVSADSQGNIWFPDSDNNRIVKVNSSWEALGWWGKDNTGTTGWHSAGSPALAGYAGDNDGQFNIPQNIVIVKKKSSGQSDYIYVAERENDRISKYRINGDGSLSFIGWWGSTSTSSSIPASWHGHDEGPVKNYSAGLNVIRQPFDIAYEESTDRLYVVGNGTMAIYVFQHDFNDDGIRLNGWFGADVDSGPLVWHDPSFPTNPKYAYKLYGMANIEKSSDGFLYVNTTSKILQINPNGWAIPKEYTSSGEALAVTKNYIFYADSYYGVVIMNKAGQIVKKISNIPFNNNKFEKVHGISLDIPGKMVITDSGKDRFIIYDVDELVLVKTVDKAEAGPGDIVEYTIKVMPESDEASFAATDLNLSDPVPAGTTFQSATDGGTAEGGIINWDLGSYAPKEIKEVSFRVTVN